MTAFDPIRRSLLIAGAGVAVSAFRPGDSLFAPKADLIARWRAHDPNGDVVADHDAWADLLSRRLSVDRAGVARVAYGDFTSADRRQLDDHLARLAAVDVDRMTRPRQYAFWLNLYNAAVVQTVLTHYPVRSIQDIDTSPGLFSNGPWKAPAVRVGGATLSLDDVEHGVLRPIFKDPRIHYAVNCAAVGCPNLRGEPYVSARLDAQLDEQARLYVNDPRGIGFDRRGGPVVSRIYAWFCEDFGRNDAEVLDHIRRYAAPDLLRRLNGVDEIAETRYDWALNDAATAG